MKIHQFRLVINGQKFQYWFYWMQILAAAKRFANKYCYQLDSLELSRDQKNNAWTVTGVTLSLNKQH